MFFNKSKPLFLAIICFFAVQTGVVTAAETPSAGTSLWATFIAGMNHLMPSLNSLMSNIAAKISSFMSSTSFSEYKGHAAAGLGGALATVLGYKVLDLVPKRAKELEKELFKDYPATLSNVEHYMIECGQIISEDTDNPDYSEIKNLSRFVGILTDMNIIKDALVKENQRYNFIDKKALSLLLAQREETLVNLPYIPKLLSLPERDPMYDYEASPFEDFINSGVDTEQDVSNDSESGSSEEAPVCMYENKEPWLQNKISFWIEISGHLFGDNPEDRLKGLEWLRSRPIFSGKDDKYGLGKTIELWKKKYEAAVQNKVEEIRRGLVSANETQVNEYKQKFQQDLTHSDFQKENSLKVILGLRDMGQILTAIDSIDTYPFITQKAFFSLLSEKENDVLAASTLPFYSLPLRAKMNYDNIPFDDLMDYRCGLVRQNDLIPKITDKCLDKYPNVADRRPNKTDSWIMNGFFFWGSTANGKLVLPTPEQEIKRLELLRKISPHYSEFADPQDKSGLAATIKLLKKKKAEKEQESKTILP